MTGSLRGARPGRFGRGRRTDSLARMAAPTSVVDTVVSLCKRRGFVFPCGEIYGGTRSAWDYGPLGVELKENIKRQWWRSMVTGRDDIVGLDSSVILPRQVVGRLRPRRRVHRPADRVPQLPQALPRRPPAGGLREGGEEGQGRRPRRDRPGRHRLPELRHPRPVDRAARVQHAAQDLPRRRSRTSPACTTCGPRPRRASSSTSPTSCRPRARSRRSASARSARASATRSRPATSSSAPASSSRWRWSSSSSPATDEEWHQYWIDERTELVHRPRHRPATTCGTTSTRRRSCRTTPSAPSTSSTASASPGSEWGELEGIANRTDFDLTTHTEALRHRPVLLRPGQRRAVHAVRHRARGRPDPLADGLPRRRLHRGRGAQHQGRRRQARRARLDPRLAPVKAAVLPLSRNERPLAQGPRPRGRRCAGTGTSTSTTPARSAAATAARTRSARRSASPSTSTPSTTRP